MEDGRGTWSLSGKTVEFKGDVAFTGIGVDGFIGSGELGTRLPAASQEQPDHDQTQNCSQLQ